MGPVDWIGVFAAWLVAAILGLAFYGKAALPVRAPVRHAAAALLLLFSALMLGHNFARIGAETLSAKPWLCFMMSGGLALAFAGPALFVTDARRNRPLRVSLYDYAYWIVAYLGMGTVYWLRG